MSLYLYIYYYVYICLSSILKTLLFWLCRGEQLDALAQQIGRLAQDLDATKLELAEVVIEKEEDEGELKREVELLRKALEGQKALQQKEEAQISAVEKRLLEASEQQSSVKTQLEQRLQGCEERLLQGELQQTLLKERMEDCAAESTTRNLFEKLDISMKEQLDRLRQAQVDLETKQKGALKSEDQVRRASARWIST